MKKRTFTINLPDDFSQDRIELHIYNEDKTMCKILPIELKTNQELEKDKLEIFLAFTNNFENMLGENKQFSSYFLRTQPKEQVAYYLLGQYILTVILPNLSNSRPLEYLIVVRDYIDVRKKNIVPLKNLFWLEEKLKDNTESLFAELEHCLSEILKLYSEQTASYYFFTNVPHINKLEHIYRTMCGTTLENYIMPRENPLNK